MDIITETETSEFSFPMASYRLYLHSMIESLLKNFCACQYLPIDKSDESEIHILVFDHPIGTIYNAIKLNLKRQVRFRLDLG